MVQPDFNHLNPRDVEKFNQFFHRASPANIQKYCHDLNNITDLFEHVVKKLEVVNPFRRETAIKARQWELDSISDIKVRLSMAIDYKKKYYENHWFGKITRLFLMIIGMWDNGITPTIKKAEEKLFRWDTRKPLVKLSAGYEVVYFFFLLIPLNWVVNNLDTSKFYNYNPNRRIKIINNQFWNNGLIEN